MRVTTGSDTQFFVLTKNSVQTRVLDVKHMLSDTKTNSILQGEIQNVGNMRFLSWLCTWCSVAMTRFLPISTLQN